MKFLHMYRTICLHMCYTKSLHVIYTHSVFTCSTGFSSLYMTSIRPQRDCLWSPHINPMESVNHSCGYSGGSLRPGL